MLTQAQLDDMIQSEITFVSPEGDATAFRCSLRLKLGATVSGVIFVDGSVDSAEREAYFTKVRAKALSQVRAIAKYAQANGVKASTPKERVKDELTETCGRLSNLSVLLSKKRPDHISKHQWELIQEQQTVMYDLAEILDARLKEWDI